MSFVVSRPFARAQNVEHRFDSRAADRMNPSVITLELLHERVPLSEGLRLDLRVHGFPALVAHHNFCVWCIALGPKNGHPNMIWQSCCVNAT